MIIGTVSHKDKPSGLPLARRSSTRAPGGSGRSSAMKPFPPSPPPPPPEDCEEEESQLHHLTESDLCNTGEVMEIQSNKRVPRTVPVFTFAANLHDRSIRDSCDPEEGQAWLPRILSKVRVLRDTGASRNFISQATVSRLDLPVTTGASPLRVRLADGSVNMSAQVVDLKVHFPSYTYEGLFQVLEMGTSDVDLIWGTPWEASLGDVTSNYDTGVLSFVHTLNKSAQKVILRSELHQG